MNGHIRTLCFFLAEMVSPGHVGSGRRDDPFSDCPILRTQAGVPLIPGGSWAGVFKLTLSKELRAKWMGQDATPAPSRVIWNDALPVPDQCTTLMHPVDTRTSVTILRKSLTAKPDHLFSSETLPVGARFAAFCRLDADSLEESHDFVECVKTFLKAAPRIGGKNNSGLGRWQASHLYVVRLDLSKPQELCLWMKSGHGYDWRGNSDDLQQRFPKACEVIPIDSARTAKRWTMTLRATIHGLHMVAGASGLPVKDAPDIGQAVRQRIDERGIFHTEFVDFGSSVKGQVRTLMEMLLRTHLKAKGMHEADVLKVVPEDPAPKNDNQLSRCAELRDFLGHKAHRGGFRAEEMVWHDAVTSHEDHIRLCEFTQQVIDGAKFLFAPLCKGTSQLEVSLPDNAPGWQKELMAQVGRLLSLNILPFGGHGSRGYLGCTFEAPAFSCPPPSGELKHFLGKV